MKGGKLFGVGVTGTVVAAVCCATPALAILLGAVGLSAWLAWSDYVVIPALLVFLAVAVFGLIRWRLPAAARFRGRPQRRVESMPSWMSTGDVLRTSRSSSWGLTCAT